ncbi:hypothetical protein AARAC_010629, partial [Aspergillus arachidicola]
MSKRLFIGQGLLIRCILRIESDAVEAIVDEFWEDDDDHQYSKTRRNPNSYTLGQIGKHPAVLAYMPGMGKVNPASVAARFRASSSNIQLGLVVGICSGVPQPPTDDSSEIFLGDIIFEDRFVRKNTMEGNLGRLSPEVWGFLHLVQGWRARTQLRQHFPAYIAEICGKEGFRSWNCPPPEEDKLFNANYCYKHQDPSACAICAQCVNVDSAVCDDVLTLSCEALGCDESQLAFRDCRSTLLVETEQSTAKALGLEIHYGRMGSGDSVIKSALHRDQIARQEDVIGFEMEGAGVWDNFPTMVIKGVLRLCGQPQEQEMAEIRFSYCRCVYQGVA